jgi:hypothetical protein
MKTAIYIEDGVVQLVITPESDFEKNALKAFEANGDVSAQIFRGTFYDCRGGWVRQKQYYSPMYGDMDHNDQSLILRNVPTPKPSPDKDVPEQDDAH